MQAHGVEFEGMNLRTQPDLELACDKQKINPTQHAINLEIQWLVVIPKKIKIKKLSLTRTHITLVPQMYTPLMSKYFLKKRHLKEASGFPDKGKKKSGGFPVLLFYPNLFLPREVASLSLSLSLSLIDSQNMFFFYPLHTRCLYNLYLWWLLRSMCSGCFDHSRGLLVLISVW